MACCACGAATSAASTDNRPRSDAKIHRLYRPLPTFVAEWCEHPREPHHDHRPAADASRQEGRAQDIGQDAGQGRARAGPQVGARAEGQGERQVAAAAAGHRAAEAPAPRRHRSRPAQRTSSMRRTPTSSFRRRPTPASCPTCASRSPTRTCAWNAAAGRARSPCASCPSRPTWPASTCASTPAPSARCIGTRKPSGRTCSTATRASPSSMPRAAAS